MEELSNIHERLQKQGCGIVGIEDERGEVTEEVKKNALALLEEKGTNYPNVVVPEGNEIFDSLTGWPTTFFVDGEGKILKVIVGANARGYEVAVEGLLQ